jgi:hypothetical protein
MQWGENPFGFGNPFQAGYATYMRAVNPNWGQNGYRNPNGMPNGGAAPGLLPRMLGTFGVPAPSSGGGPQGQPGYTGAPGGFGPGGGIGPGGPGGGYGPGGGNGPGGPGGPSGSAGMPDPVVGAYPSNWTSPYGN